MPQGPIGAIVSKPRLSKIVTTTTYELKPSDWQYNALVLSAGAPTVVTIPEGVITGDFSVAVVDLVGGGSVVAASGVTFVAPNGATLALAGSLAAIVGVSDDHAVLGGDTTT